MHSTHPLLTWRREPVNEERPASVPGGGPLGSPAAEIGEDPTQRGPPAAARRRPGRTAPSRIRRRHVVLVLRGTGRVPASLSGTARPPGSGWRSAAEPADSSRFWARAGGTLRRVDEPREPPDRLRRRIRCGAISGVGAVETTGKPRTACRSPRTSGRGSGRSRPGRPRRRRRASPVRARPCRPPLIRGRHSGPCLPGRGVRGRPSKLLAISSSAMSARRSRSHSRAYQGRCSARANAASTRGPTVSASSAAAGPARASPREPRRRAPAPPRTFGEPVREEQRGVPVEPPGVEPVTNLRERDRARVRPGTQTRPTRSPNARRTRASRGTAS